MQEILTVSEAAAYLKKHPTTIRRWILHNRLKARKISAGGEGVYVLLKTDVLEFAVAEMVKKERKIKKRKPPATQEELPI